MSERDDWTMSLLADQGAYRGEYPDWMRPSHEAEGPEGGPWTASMAQAHQVGRSLIDIARTAPGHAARGLMSGIASLGVPPDPIPFGDTSEEFDRSGLEGAQAARKQLEAATYEPQTMAGHYMGSVAEIMGNPLNWAGPGGAAAKAGWNVASGVGGETGAQAAKGTPYEGAARLAGSFGPLALERGWAATGPLVRAMPQSVGAFGGKIVQPQPKMGELAAPEAAAQAIRRESVVRGRSGRPIETAPLPIGTEQAILDIGASRLAGPKPIASFDDLRRILDQNEKAYVRWSASPEHDMAPGAVSRDYQSGELHGGLSAQAIDRTFSDDQLFRFLRDYGYLRGKGNEAAMPRLYAGKAIGKDSDFADSIVPSKALGTLSPEFVRFIDNPTNLERMNLADELAQGRKALAYYAKNPPAANEILIWTPPRVAEIEARLAKAGGPVEMPGSRPPQPEMLAMRREGPQPAPMGELAQPFYSAAVQAVTNSPLTKAPAAQWLGTLRNAPGVKPEELQRLGLEQWLAQQPGPVSKQAVADYVAANRVNVGAVVKGPPKPVTDNFENYLAQYRERFPTSQQSDAIVRGYYDRGLSMPAPGELSAVNRIAPTKFQTYQLPGGENYRETLLTLRQPPLTGTPMEQIEAAVSRPTFSGSHWDEPNVLAHYRTNDRTIDGKKTLFLEEVQSDWHQAGRKGGYRENTPSPRAELDRVNQELNAIDERHPYTGQSFQEYLRSLPREDAVRYESLGTRATQLRDDLYRFEVRQVKESSKVPDAPFKTTWPELALKRAIREAAEGGYDQIAWTPGKVQNERYQLSNHLKELKYIKRADGSYEIAGTRKDGGGFNHPGAITADQLPNVVGQEMAEKIVKGEGSGARGWPSNMRSLSGIDLEVGGEGMKGFYDKMLPAAANKIGKKYGAEVGQAQLELPPRHDFTERDPSGRPAIKFENQTVHTLPITPQLRETALRKGFPLFQLGAGGVGLGALAAQDRYQPNEL